MFKIIKTVDFFNAKKKEILINWLLYKKLININLILYVKFIEKTKLRLDSFIYKDIMILSTSIIKELYIIKKIWKSIILKYIYKWKFITYKVTCDFKRFLI